MSKASRRRAGRKPKHDVNREPNGQASRRAVSKEMHEHVAAARARKAKVTGREDLPIDVLGILYGHKRIEDAEYQIGRKLEGLMNRIYGIPTEGPSAMFREVVSVPNAEDVVAAVGAMTDEAAELLFRRMDMTLRDCGLIVHGVTIGAVRYCRYPKREQEIALIVEGLVALAKGHSPKIKTRSEMLHKAA